MRISIITVVYNAVATIEKTIVNVLNQKYSDLEYIVIDGDSTDGTLAVINRYHEKISHVISEHDNGIYDAMNKGVNLATGDIIAFLNSGDWYEDNSLIKVADYFSDKNSEILIGVANIVEDGKIIDLRNNYPEQIEYKMPCCHQAVFVRKDVFNKIGAFDNNYTISADFEWLLRAYRAKIEIQWTKDILVNYDANGISTCMELKSIAEARKIALKYTEGYKNRSMIEKKYNKMLEDAQKRERCFCVCRDRPQLIKDMLRNTVCYIWGTGNNGKLCYKMFSSANISVEGFIDSNKRFDRLYGLKVFCPNEILNTGQICIASSVYEKEIYEQAIRMGISSDRLSFFSKMLEKMLEM